MTEAVNRHAFVFGYGFIGAAFADRARDADFILTTTARSVEKRQALLDAGIDAIDPDDGDALRHAVGRADTILITPAPTDDGCPAFAALHGLDLAGKWVGYLSTTGVYGDRGGGWVFEDSALIPSSAEGRRRVTAEQQWLGLGAQVFRLPGLYGPGRNPIARLMAGDARRIQRPGHVFSRLHHDDCASALLTSVARPHPGRIYNLCDDRPASSEDVLQYAAALCGVAAPPPTPFDDLSPATRRFYADNKRVSNARAKAELGWRPAYPTYVEGLDAIWAAIYRDRQTA